MRRAYVFIVKTSPTGYNAGMAAQATLTRTRRSLQTRKRTVKVYGRYIIADSAVCHGALTFRGTRIFVRDVLSQVAEGRDWESISAEWRGKVGSDAIAEAVRLAREALLAEGVHPVVEATGIIRNDRE